MLKRIFIGLAAALAVLGVIVALQPSEYRVERSATVAASAEVVFAQVNDLHKWGAWSPWEKIDPAMTRTHDGAPAGTGASYAWAGNKNVGAGRMTLTESRPAELIRIRLEFLEPFASEATAEFSFKPEGNQTRVTWSMAGGHNFMGKAIGMVMNMDTMIGGEFEKGLADLKTLSEGAAKN